MRSYDIVVFGGDYCGPEVSSQTLNEAGIES